jgi:diguanylate cyclase (GGDEF)-like protein
MGFVDPELAGSQMTIPKFRAAIVVFIIGFALGLSVFVASRLVVRSVLSADAVAAAEEVAAQLAKNNAVEATGTLSSVVQYRYFDGDGNVVASESPKGAAELPLMSDSDRDRLTNIALRRGSVIDDTPLLPSLFGLTDAVKWVIVPVVADGKAVGTLLAEVDQTHSIEALTRAFSVIGMMTVGLAVLAVIAVAFVVTRGSGFGRQKRAFDASTLPRDPLTDVPTRTGLTAALEDAVERATEADQQVGLMIVGLDGFRAVNDIWGHAAGDEVLQVAAERLRAFASGPVGVARVAGDEFAVIVEGDATQTMHKIADEIREAIGAPFEIQGSSILLGASIGAALYPINAESAQFLFRAADSALSKAKTEGRNSLAVFDTEMKERMVRKAALERDMRLALSRGEFVVFYQPQIELSSGLLRGYEALVRWERPHEGILAPRDFLAVAEETGLVREIGDWVLHRACEDAASWLESGIVAVNFSAAQLRAPDVDKKIAKVLEETGLAADRLEIEVPEHLFLHNAPELMAALSRIKALGVRIAMDDFGAGYSGLAALAQFPFNKVKIDRTFVSQLTEDGDVAAIVSAIVALGRTLSVDVTAEGVESSEQVTLLRAAGCSIVQGFLFGAPKRHAEDEPPGYSELTASATDAPAQATGG